MKIASAKFTGFSGKIRIEETVKGEFFLHIPTRKYNEPFVIEIRLIPRDGKSNYYMAPLI